MSSLTGLIVILGLLLIIGLITAGLRGANALLRRTQAAQDEAMERHRAGLVQIEESAILQREAVELARRATAASETTARLVGEIHALILARTRGSPSAGAP